MGSVAGQGALSHMHAGSIAHNDIKPSNICVDVHSSRTPSFVLIDVCSAANFWRASAHYEGVYSLRRAVYNVFP